MPLSKRRSPCRLLLSLLICAAGAAAPADATDWPHWRGHSRNDQTPENSGWNGQDWQVEQSWRLNVGEGCSSPLVVAGKVYVMGWKDGKDWLHCLDLASGERVWRQSYACPRYGRQSVGDKGIYSGIASTPEYDADTAQLYTLSIDGDLICWDSTRGTRRWSMNLYERYGVGRRPDVGGRRSRRDYGYTSSPLISGELLLVEVGAKTGNLIAFDKRKGKELWRSENRDEAGHSGGPVPLTVGGRKCAAVLTLRNLVVTELDGPKPGRTLGQLKWTTDFGNNIPTPAVQDQTILITSAYNHYAIARVDVSPKGLKKVWETRDVASGVCSPIIASGRVYWAWRGVHCLDLATGKPVWTGGKVGSAGSCVLTGDKRLVVWSNRGDLSLVETAYRSPRAYKQLAQRNRLLGSDAWPHVVLASGALLVKDRQGNLICFRVGG